MSDLGIIQTSPLFPSWPEGERALPTETADMARLRQPVPALGVKNLFLNINDDR